MKKYNYERLNFEVAEIIAKPCPFCGEQPNIFQIPSKLHKNKPVWIIECKDMGCVLYRTNAQGYLKVLIAKWNERKEVNP